MCLIGIHFWQSLTWMFYLLNPKKSVSQFRKKKITQAVAQIKSLCVTSSSGEPPWPFAQQTGLSAHGRGISPGWRRCRRRCEPSDIASGRSALSCLQETALKNRQVRPSLSLNQCPKVVENEPGLSGLTRSNIWQSRSWKGRGSMPILSILSHCSS